MDFLVALLVMVLVMQKTEMMSWRWLKLSPNFNFLFVLNKWIVTVKVLTTMTMIFKGMVTATKDACVEKMLMISNSLGSHPLRQYEKFGRVSSFQQRCAQASISLLSLGRKCFWPWSSWYHTATAIMAMTILMIAMIGLWFYRCVGTIYSLLGYHAN